MSWIISLIISFVITAAVTPLLIPFLKKLKFGQMILEDGPTWHAKKQGTPTMGGLAFILALTASSLIVSRSAEMLFVVIIGLLFGAVGFVDDYIKVVKKRNKGFSAKAKFICQSVVALGAAVYMYASNSHAVKIPFMAGSFDFSWFYIPFVMFVMLATVNSVNLTDGVDGLASSVSAACALFFLVAALKMGYEGVAIAVSAMIGGVLGFLLYNFFPAKVFMGDTGSLYLGGILSAAAVMMGLEFSLIIAGGVFLSETLSVIIQVTSFKLTGKRVFKMSPLHHHFEMCGWKETKIVGVFTFVTLLLCAVCYLALK
ncbi:MAG: phospho-N-acetylmuramoyl-pentapeptide-transferase [Clostridia bacterium]|nr:phospho-N-acetylmuramoyl-pentapeptide-transferase [Clostridia bacterium]